MRLEPLEPRLLLSADLTPFKDIISSGLDDVADWIDDELSQLEELGQDIPLLHDAIGDLIDIGDELRTKIADQVDDFFTIDLDPQTDELATHLQDFLSGIAETADSVVTAAPGNTLEVQVDFQLERAAVVDLSMPDNPFGLSLGDDAQLSATIGIDFDFTFGVDPTEGLTPGEAFYIAAPASPATTLSAGVTVDVTGGSDFGIQVGMLEAQVQSPDAQLAAAIDVGLVDPNGNDRLTATELMGTPLESLVNVGLGPSSGAVDMTLPLHAELGTGVGAFSADGVVTITDANLFEGDAPAVGFTVADPLVEGPLKNWRNITPADVVGIFEFLGNSIQGISDALDPDLPLDLLDEGLNQIVDFADAIGGFARELFDVALADASAYTAPSLPDLPGGVLTADAVFQVILNDGSPVEITVPSGTTLANAVTEINTDFGSTLATLESGFLKLAAPDADDRLEIRYEASSEGMTQLGFVPELSNADFNFSSIQELITELAGLTNLNEAGIDVQYDLDNLLTFNLDVTRGATQVLPLNFTQEIDLGLGTLAITGKADARFHGSASVNARFGVDLSPVGNGFEIDPGNPSATSLASLNGGKGVQILTGKPDLSFELRNPSLNFDVNLDGAANLGDVISAINSQSSGNVTASVIPDDPLTPFIQENVGLRLVDNTAGGGTFRVEKAVTGGESSVAGFGLGILGSDIDDDGVIDGFPLHGDTLFRHAFVEDGASVTASVHVEDESGIDLIASLGSLEVGVENGDADFNLGASLTLNDPDSDGRIDLDDLVSGAEVAQVRGTTEAVASGQLTTDAVFKLALNGGDLVTVTVAAADTADNTTVSDLVLDVNLALDATALPGSYADAPLAGQNLGDFVTATAEDGVVVLNASVGGLAIEVDTPGSNTAVTEMALPATESASSFVVATTFTASGEISLPLTIEGVPFEIPGLPATPTITLEFSANSPIRIDPEFSGIEDFVDAFSNFGTDDLFALLEQVLELVRSSDLGILNDAIPLVNESVNDLLGFAETLLGRFDEVTGDLQGLKDDLLASVPVPDAPNLQEIKDSAAALLAAAQMEVADVDLPAFEDASDQLLEALDALDGAVRTLPDGVGDLTTAPLPGKLFSAAAALVAAVRDPAFDLPAVSTQLDAVKAQLEKLSNRLPAVQRLVDYVFDALNLRSLISEDMLTALKTGVLPDLETLVGDLDTLAESVPTLEDAATAFAAARDKLDEAVGTAASVADIAIGSLLEAFDQLVAAVDDWGAAIAAEDMALADDLAALVQPFSESFPGRLRLDFSGTQLGLGLDFDFALSTGPQQLDFELDLGLGDILPVTIDTDGMFDLGFGGEFTLDLGIDLDQIVSDPAEALFLLPSTQLALTAFIEATDLQAGLSIGGVSLIELGPTGNEASLLFKADPSDAANHDPASLGIGFTLANDDGDGKIQLDELLVPGTITFNATGGFELSAPIAIGGNLVLDDMMNVDPLTATLGDLTDFSTFSFTIPTNFLDALTGGLLDVGLLVDGIQAFLGKFADGLQSEIIGGLPIIGDGLSFAGTKLQDFIDFTDALQTKIDDILGEADETIVEPKLQEFFFELLGPPGLDILALDPEFHDSDADMDGDPGTNPDTVPDKFDVPVEVTGNLLTDPNAEVRINLSIGAADELDAPFDLGFGGLGLVSVATSGAVSVDLEYGIDIGFGLNKTDGFFLILNPDDTPEFDFHVAANVLDGTTFELKLFFLKLMAESGDFSGDEGSGIGNDGDGDGRGTGFEGDVGVDLSGPGGSDDIPLLQIPSIQFNAQLDADVQVDLRLDASLTRKLPGLTADLLVEWGFDGNSGLLGDVPNVELNDITFDLGEFLSSAVGDILGALDDFIDPLRPLLGFLDSEIPLISDVSKLVGGGEITFLDAIASLGSGADTVATVIGILNKIGGIDLSGPSALVKFGDIHFDPMVTDLRDQIGDIAAVAKGAFAVSQDEIDAGTPAKFGELEGDPDGGDDGVGLAFPLLDDPTILANLLFGKDVDLIAWDVPRLEAGFEYSQLFGPIIPPFPIFAKIGGYFSIFADFYVGFDTRGLRTGNFLNGLFFGDRIPTTPQGEDVPELGFVMGFTAGAEFNIAFAVAGVEGGVEAGIYANWNDIDENGKFYIDEVVTRAGQGLECIFDLEGALTAFLRAYLNIEIPLGFTSITIIDVDFVIVDVVLFDFTASCPPLPPPIPAHVVPAEAMQTVAGDGVRDAVDLAEGSLAEGFIPAEGTLILHAGQFSDLRQPGASDVDDFITIRGETDVNGDGVVSVSEYAGIGGPSPTNGFVLTLKEPEEGGEPQGGGEADVLGDDLDGDGLLNTPDIVVVQAYGVTHIYTGITGILYLDLAGDDENVLLIDPSVSQNVTVVSGAGEDEIQTGSGDDNVRTAGAADEITAGAGNDTVSAGAGDDVVFGNAGADVIAGGDGDDTLYGGNNDRRDEGDLGDTLMGQGGNDRLYGALGGDHIEGGDGADVLHGGRGADTLLGQADDDQLFGDEETDFRGDPDPSGEGDSMEGGSGSDQLAGGIGDDRMIGGSSSAGSDGDDLMLGGAGDDVMLGDNGVIGSVTLIGGSGEDTLIAGDGADSLYGQGGDDVLLGDNGTLEAGTGNVVLEDSEFGGADYMEGNANDDLMYGGEGDDWMIGGSSTLAGTDGADTLFGSLGNDILLGDNGTIIAGGVVATNAGGGSGRDRLFGAEDDDVLFGGGRGDTLSGSGGNDVIVGDQGTRNASSITADHSATANSGGADTITGSDGEDTLLGGDAGDEIGGDQLADIIVGDNGMVSFTAGVVTQIETKDFAHGGDDTITGSGGADVVLGGSGADWITGGGDGADDILLGDNGVVQQNNPSVNDIFSNDTTGGSDTIDGGPGADTLFGGTADDTLRGGSGPDVMLGDHGRIDRDGAEVIQQIETTLTASGGDDLILGQGDRDIALGGFGGDSVSGDGADDILLGDNGKLDFELDLNLATLDRIETSAGTSGGADTISGNAGNDIVIGGRAGDELHGDAATTAAGDGRDVVVGDNARIDLVDSQGTDVTGTDGIVAFGGAIATLRTTDEVAGTGGADTLTGDAEGDVLAGGVLGDTLHGNGGDDVVMGDNARLEWLYTGDAAFSEIEDALEARTGHDFSAESDFTTLDLVTTELPAAQPGGRDVIFGDAGRDFAFGGTDADTIWGDDGDEVGSADHADVLFGDHGRIYPQLTALPGFNSRNYFSIDTGDMDGGAGDRIRGEEGDDVLVGQQGDDRLFGGSEDDDLIGGHNTAGGIDELSAPVIDAEINPPVNDILDGGTGDDALAGDNATIWRKADVSSPRFQALSGTELYNPFDPIGGPDDGLPDGAAAVTGTPEADPNGAVGRDIEMLDHDAATQAMGGARPFGDDLMAGGSDRDLLFGELGSDLMQGDGSIDAVMDGDDGPSLQIDVTDAGVPDTGGTLWFNVAEADSDGDDYLEGNGGADTLYGGLGQDDLIGGSSSLFGLDTGDERPDGSDLIFGGAGDPDRTARNAFVGSGEGSMDDDPRIALVDRHARDADTILGDNGNIFRIVGTDGGPGGGFEEFVYDADDPERGDLRVVPRAIDLLDYVPGVGDTMENGVAHGGADTVHGESGDDTLHGTIGDDILYGESEDDDVYGEAGNDWASAGTGEDGVLGDDGYLLTSRIGAGGEPLHGVAALSQADLDLRIRTPGNIQQSRINITGELKKAANLEPFSLGGDDILYGGLGDDFLHGGAGDDAMSGAEALPVSGTRAGGALHVVTYVAPDNPGDALSFEEFKTGEFALYDENDPLRKILLTADGTLSKDGTGTEFLLNFEAFGDALDPVGTQIHDGDDVLFGDDGNDWLVGGTDQDHLYGGFGADYHQVDDNLETNGQLNDMPDVAAFSGLSQNPDKINADTAYGGAGRDVLIGNTGADRLIDWVGEFNSYIVPYAPFGQFSVSRSLQPQLRDYLYDLSENDGGDPTRADDTGEDPLRNGEPEGELGLVLQQDDDWKAQTGAPDDPQAGNIPGGQRDVMEGEDFDGGGMGAFAVDAGDWAVVDGALEAAAGGEGAVVYHLDELLPSYFEVATSVNIDKATAGDEANAYIIFDYQSETDFKFAGVSASYNKAHIGSRTSEGWFVEANIQVTWDADYDMTLAVDGAVATLWVNGDEIVSHTFGDPLADPLADPLNDGMVGLSVDDSQTVFDDFQILVPLPVISLTLGDDFESPGFRDGDLDNDGVVDGSDFALFAAARQLQTFEAGADPNADLNANGVIDFDDLRLFRAAFRQQTAGAPDLLTAQTGVWVAEDGHYEGRDFLEGEPLVSTLALDVQTAAGVGLEAYVGTDDVAGLVFDYYGPDDFKFAGISVSSGEVVVGHQEASGWVVEAAVSHGVSGAGHLLDVQLDGTSVVVSVDGVEVLAHLYNGLLNDGELGVFAVGGDATFDDLRVTTDDPAYLPPEGQALQATRAPDAPLGLDGAIAPEQLQPVVEAAIQRWSDVLGAEAVAGLSDLCFELVDLPGLTLGRQVGDTVRIDPTAAGHGWFVDDTPLDDSEFRQDHPRGDGIAWRFGDAHGVVDLLSVVSHEMGHALGFDDGQLSGATLATGIRIDPADLVAGGGEAVDYSVEVVASEAGEGDSLHRFDVREISLDHGSRALDAQRWSRFAAGLARHDRLFWRDADDLDRNDDGSADARERWRGFRRFRFGA